MYRADTQCSGQTKFTLQFPNNSIHLFNFIHYTIVMVTLMPKLPFSANNWAILVSNARQSDWVMACATPSWMLRGVASQHSLLLCVDNSNL